jgi:alkaline phosphatase D
MGVQGNWEKRRVGTLEGLGAIDRRKFLALSGMSAAALILGGGPLSEKTMARPFFRDDPFSLGVASGDPLPDGVVIWTRLAPDPLAKDGSGGMPARKVPVRWEVATDEGFRKVVRRGWSFATPELAHSVHVDVEGLDPAREYFYRFKVGPEISPVGRTKTAPTPGAKVSELRFAFASCQQYEHGYYTAYRHMAEEELDLVVHLGDYIYEYGPNEYVTPGGNVRKHVPGSEIFGLRAYRIRHAQYKTDRNLRAAHAAFPWIVTWDDHEVENNYADEISEEDSEQDQDPEVFLRRRAAAYQAFYEHMPLRRSSVPRGPNARLYRRLTYGKLAEFNVLDTRQYRTDQPCGDAYPADCPGRFDPDQTITGERQERWLRRGLAASHSRWNVLAQQIFMAQIDLVGGPKEGFYVDGWDGYVASRDRLLDFLYRRRISNPVVLTGDWHANWLCDLKTDFNDPDSPVVGAEFVGTSITSTDYAAARPAYGDVVLDENPHIRFFDNQRGYVRCRLTPEEWRTDYRVVPYVKRPGAPIRTRASFVIENGDPIAHRVGGAPSVGSTRAASRAAEADGVSSTLKPPDQP